MSKTLVARPLAITLVIAGLFTAFGAAAEEAAPARINGAQNGGEASADTTPKYNAGLNGRVKPVEAKARSQVAQNGGDAASAAYVQPKYSSALSGRAMAAPTTMAQSTKETKTAE